MPVDHDPPANPVEEDRSRPSEPAEGAPAAGAGAPAAPGQDVADTPAEAAEQADDGGSAPAGSADEPSATHDRPQEPLAAPQEGPGPAEGGSGFQVRLDVFEGPFDLLLGLISKHQLDVTEVALSKVTDDFIAHIRALGAGWDLGQATEFLVVAATLLDLKAARLLPGAEVEDEEDLALLEARDLLFARLLQYRAYKQAAAHLERLVHEETKRFPRQVSLEPQYAGLLPEVLLGLGPAELAALAAKALTPRAIEQVAVDHVHGGMVSVREQTALLHERLRRTGGASFRSLTADCQSTLEVVARFLGLLELYRESLVAFEQAEALGDLHVRWTGPTGEGDDSDMAALSAGAEWDEPMVVDLRSAPGDEGASPSEASEGTSEGRVDVGQETSTEQEEDA